MFFVTIACDERRYHYAKPSTSNVINKIIAVDDASFVIIANVLFLCLARVQPWIFWFGVPVLLLLPGISTM